MCVFVCVPQLHRTCVDTRCKRNCKRNHCNVTSSHWWTPVHLCMCRKQGSILPVSWFAGWLHQSCICGTFARSCGGLRWVCQVFSDQKCKNCQIQLTCGLCGMWHMHIVDKSWPPLSALNWYHRRLLFVACHWPAAFWHFRWFCCKLKCATNKIATNTGYLYAPLYMLHATCMHVHP